MMMADDTMYSDVVYTLRLLLVFSYIVSPGLAVGLFSMDKQEASLEITFDNNWKIVFEEPQLNDFYKCLCSDQTLSCGFEYTWDTIDSYKVSQVFAMESVSLNVSIHSFVCTKDGTGFKTSKILCTRESIGEYTRDPSFDVSKYEFFSKSCKTSCVEVGWPGNKVTYSDKDDLIEITKGQCPTPRANSAVTLETTQATNKTPETTSTSAAITPSEGKTLRNVKDPISIPDKSPLPMTTGLDTGVSQAVSDPVSLQVSIRHSSTEKGDEYANVIYIGAGAASFLVLTIALVVIFTLKRKQKFCRKIGYLRIFGNRLWTSSNEGTFKRTFNHERFPDNTESHSTWISADQGYTTRFTPGSVYCTIADTHVTSANLTSFKTQEKQTYSKLSNSRRNSEIGNHFLEISKMATARENELRPLGKKQSTEERRDGASSSNVYNKLQNSRFDTSRENMNEIYGTYNVAAGEYKAKTEKDHGLEIRSSTGAMDSYSLVPKAGNVADPVSHAGVESEAQINASLERQSVIEDKNSHTNALVSKPQSNEYFVLDADQVKECGLSENGKPCTCTDLSTENNSNNQTSEYFTLEKADETENVDLDTGNNSVENVPDGTVPTHELSKTEYFELENYERTEYIELDSLNVERNGEEMPTDGTTNISWPPKTEYFELEGKVGSEYVDLDARMDGGISDTAEHQRTVYYELDDVAGENDGNTNTVNETLERDTEMVTDNIYQEIGPLKKKKWGILGWMRFNFK